MNIWSYGDKLHVLHLCSLTIEEKIVLVEVLVQDDKLHKLHDIPGAINASWKCPREVWILKSTINIEPQSKWPKNTTGEILGFQALTRERINLDGNYQVT